MSKLLENLLDEPERGTLVYIPTHLIEPHPDNPRKNLGDLTELADSIRQNGILQNLTVVPQEDGRYRALIGHRRLAAAKMAGLTEVPCVIVEMSYRDQLQTMLQENMQRSDLTVYEQAQGFPMMWIKQDGEIPGYTCARCGSLWLTVDTTADPPKECKACGATEESETDGV